MENKSSNGTERKIRDDRYCASQDCDLMMQFLNSRSEYVIERLGLKYKAGQQFLKKLNQLHSEWGTLAFTSKQEKLIELLSSVDTGNWPKVKVNFRRFKHSRTSQAIYLPRDLLASLAPIPGDDYAQKIECLVDFFAKRRLS